MSRGDRRSVAGTSPDLGKEGKGRWGAYLRDAQRQGEVVGEVMVVADDLLLPELLVGESSAGGGPPLQPCGRPREPEEEGKTSAEAPRRGEEKERDGRRWEARYSPEFEGYGGRLHSSGKRNGAAWGRGLRGNERGTEEGGEGYL